MADLVHERLQGHFWKLADRHRDAKVGARELRDGAREEALDQLQILSRAMNRSG